ncbi:hypothetical protein [Lysobacter sp. CA199]|uniref:hypothetical protein n=1 Tax=Lysobacter sp. CA199 TaxID=3455608 RepID=UPI003F8D0B79
MEIAISIVFAAASLFVSTRVYSELGRLIFVAVTLAWACVVVLLYPGAIVRATIAAADSEKIAYDSCRVALLRLYESLQPAGISVLLCLAALAVLAVVPRPRKAG